MTEEYDIVDRLRSGVLSETWHREAHIYNGVEIEAEDITCVTATTVEDADALMDEAASEILLLRSVIRRLQDNL